MDGAATQTRGHGSGHGHNVKDLRSPPPPRLHDRLHQIAGYTWDETKRPFHSTYDFWHVFGTRYLTPASRPSTPSHQNSSPPSISRPHSSRPSPSEHGGSLSSGDAFERPLTPMLSPPLPIYPPNSDPVHVEESVVARISYHAVREERAFHITRSITSTVDPEGEHIVKPLDLIRLSPVAGDRGPVVVAIYQHPGRNFLDKALNFGPAYYQAEKKEDHYVVVSAPPFQPGPPVSLETFLDFAIGAAQCLEILHHGQGIVHGEIRGDAFHFNAETNRVRIISFGSGLRSFEHGLTSSGWSLLSKEAGAKEKLQYISPEQTGRMPAEPDSRTDIYSVGVLFWTFLTQQPVFEGDSPLDIVQGVLGKRIPNVSTLRIDVPNVLGGIIQKCTARNIADRYHSASGLRHDLVEVQKLMGDGNTEALQNFMIGTKDVSAFFMLPNTMVGRQKERNELMKVIDRVARSHTFNRNTVTASRFSDGSSLSQDFHALDENSSDGTSSLDGTNRRSNSFTQAIASDPKQQRSAFQPSLLSDTHTMMSNDTASSTQSTAFPRAAKPWDRHQSISIDSKSLIDSLEGTRQSMIEASASNSLSRQLGNAKFRRRGHCEVVTIEGAGGLGKSCLVQAVLGDARRRGYCATAKFDTLRRTAYGPLLKLMSSLFRQVWGESNTETPFHQGLKQYIRPVWPMLHRMLGLPEFLLGPADVPMSSTRSISSSQGSMMRGSVRSGTRRRGSSPATSPPPTARNSTGPSSTTSQEYLRTGSSTKTVPLMNTFLDVLRVFTSHKFICFCLDDLHFADDESLDLISQIIAARLKMVIIITYRPEELPPERVHKVIYPPEADDQRSGAPMVTKISLSPLSEGDIIQYVSDTLRRPAEEVLSLALVLQSKTGGNPFYMREMLGSCYRKRVLWYDYRDSLWHYDLDRLFENFQGEKDYDVLDTRFITRRLDELPPTARALLAWAAMIGSSWSFTLVSRLMGGEFAHEGDLIACQSSLPKRGYSEAEAIAGLQAAIQAFIIVPSENDDRFRFAHDRYVNASADLKECQAESMHFVIAQTMLKYDAEEAGNRDDAASHIVGAVKLIRSRVPVRSVYRQMLVDCARSSTENGARPTAAKYYKAAIALLQEDPWDETLEDVDYDETIQIHLRAAECQSFMAHLDAAHALLAPIFSHAKTTLDKAPAYVLQSRIRAQTGDAEASVVSLKECLRAMGVCLDEEPTFEKCDAKFQELSAQIQGMERDKAIRPKDEIDPAVTSIGAVLAETIGAAFWTDYVCFYHYTLVMLEMHLTRGAFPQSGMAFLHFATIALGRFNQTQFATELGSISLELLQQGRDAFTIGRGLMIYACFIGHIHQSMSTSIAQMEDALEYASLSGDRMSTILAYGLFAGVKFSASENVADMEAFCHYGCEEIPNFVLDSRGGAVILAVRQACRALQGKTRTHDPLEIMSDDKHVSPAFKKRITLASGDDMRNRALIYYESMELAVLYLYGHYERAVELGKKNIDKLHLLWSMRNSRFFLFFYGLSLTGLLLRRMQDPRFPSADLSVEKEEAVAQLRDFSRKIKDWAVVSNVNYMSWWRLLEAQITELTGDFGSAIEHYEEALDHSTEHSFAFEEALGHYLMAGFFIRRKARRSARSALLDAIGLYRHLHAIGVAASIEAEHTLLLHGPTRSHRVAEAGVQTDFVADTSSVIHYRPADGEDGEELAPVPSNTMTELKGERIGAWRGSMNMPASDGAGLPALDMIDLHAILVSSQVISSVLQVDELLKTMCDVILQTCGASATLAAIVIQEPESSSWCVAASGDPDNGASAHKPGLSLSGTSLIAQNVVLYCTRFLEPVFVPDLVSDERFGNANESWLQRNPSGKAIIAIPITHGTKPLLGVLYLEGEAGSFTDRNVTVLQLLVNQIGISYSNALSMKNLEKISAENRSMVSVQKRALAKALEAETKAKNAETEAKRNVKLAEEAAKAKSIFLANVSHELRTPLNGVIGNSELLRDSNLNREQLEMADSIRLSADLLLTVINDILDFSKMEADKMKLYIIAFNPEEMVREVVRAVSYSNREKTSKKNVRIIQDINLPSMLIYGDPIRLHQVLGNLIGNSLKFTEDGSITIGARLDEDTQEKAKLTFWVRDTGIGIPPQQLAKLFQPFSQADASTARKYGGSGLGLSICKSLIEIMMKGKIQLESEEKVGTTAWFTVSFEKAKSDVSAGDAQSKASQPIDRYSAPTSLTERMASPDSFLNLSQLSKEDIRICVAEDNPINQKIAIQYVQRLGFTRVVAYENGLRAVEALRQKAREGNPYHIVLMDVQMPVLDGYEATKLIRKDPLEAVRKILVIAMTASAIQGDREKCLAAGMNDYLAKPVRSEVLKKKLDAYLSAATETSEPARSAPGPSAMAPSNANGASGEEVKPPLLPRRSSGTSVPETVVHDPMEEEVIYSRPLISPALKAKESPLLIGQPSARDASLPIRENAALSKTTSNSSGKTTGSDVRRDSSTQTAEPATSSQKEKRQPRKLTKAPRTNSETNLQKLNEDKPLPPPPPPAGEKPAKGFLMKKTLQRQTSGATPPTDGSFAGDAANKPEE